MKKSILLLTAAMTMTFAAHAADTDKTMRLRFTDLPYAEGTLYIAVSCGGEHVMATAIEVSGDSIIIPLDLAGHDDKTVSIQAFQDLNSNSTLDFDTYGRPQEPCLQTTLSPGSADDAIFDLKLIQY